MPNPLFIGASYIPPEYSIRKNSIKVDYFQELNDSLVRYSQKGNVIIAGDLNSRTGNNHASDLIKIPGVNEFDLGDKTLVEDRISCDNTINNYGNKLNSICRVHDLVIANGRVPGDRVGNFTCQTNRSSLLFY